MASPVPVPLYRPNGDRNAPLPPALLVRLPLPPQVVLTQAVWNPTGASTQQAPLPSMQIWPASQSALLVQPVQTPPVRSEQASKPSTAVTQPHA
ncbi:hypothetical protein BH24ACT15_BH24ACT15_38760 [soil metagenome]